MNKKRGGISLGAIIAVIAVITIIPMIISNIFKNGHEDISLANEKGDITEINSIQGKQQPLLSDTALQLGGTVEGTLVMGNTETVNINGTSGGTLAFTNIDGKKVEASISNNKLTVSAKAEGTTEITIKESNTNKTATYKVTILPANYNVNTDNNIVYYNTIANAVASAKAGDIITVCKDVTEEKTVTIDKNIALDLQNHKITVNKTKTAITVSEGVTLNVTGQTNGELYISGTAIETEASQKAQEDHYAIYNNGTLNISSGKITGECLARNGYGIFNKGTTTVTGGEIKGAGYINGIGIGNEGTLTIESGKITSAPTSTSDTSPYAYGIDNEGGSVTVTGGEISGYTGISNWNHSGKVGEVIVNGGEITGTNTGILNNTTLKILSGEIEGGKWRNNSK